MTSAISHRVEIEGVVDEEVLVTSQRGVCFSRKTIGITKKSTGGHSETKSWELGVLAPPLRWFKFENQDVNKLVNNKIPLPQAFDWNLYVCDLWSRLLLK